MADNDATVNAFLETADQDPAKSYVCQTSKDECHGCIEFSVYMAAGNTIVQMPLHNLRAPDKLTAGA